MKPRITTPCTIHKGQLDLNTLMPVDEQGNYILFGYRKCGNRECVNPEHYTRDIKQAKRINGKYPTPLFHKRHDLPGHELAKYVKPLQPGERKPDTECAVPYCIKKVRSLNLCNGHHMKYTRWRKNNGITAKRINLDPTPVLQAVQPFYGVNHLKAKDRYCHVPECTGKYSARGLCKKHHNRYLRAINGRKPHAKTN